MLDKDIVVATSKKEFDAATDILFVNMCNNMRTLHKTYNKSCPYSKCASRFIPFSGIEEVEVYERQHKDSTPFKKCGNCFKK